MPQIEWITDQKGTIIVDEIVRFENLEREFNNVLKRLGEKATLQHLNKSNRGNYRDYYDEEAIEIVHKWFEQDIERFEYQF